MQLHREQETFRSAAAELVVIGNGTPNFIRGFREETQYDGRLYTDPSLKSYELAGLKRGFWRWFNPMALVYGVRGYARGQRQTRVKGDVHQLGGVLLIEVGGHIRFQHADSVAGDLVDKARLLRAVNELTRRAA